MPRPPLRAELTAWAKSLNFSAFTLGMIALIIAGAVMLSPGISTLVDQRRQIAELTESVRIHQEAVDEIDAERGRWKDPAYIRSQARDRLFFVMPGETQLAVINDVVIPAGATPPPTAELRTAEHNWLRAVTGSVLTAGTTTASPEALAGEQAPAGPDAEPAETDEKETP